MLMLPGRVWLPDSRSVHPVYPISAKSSSRCVRETCSCCAAGVVYTHRGPVVPLC